MDDKLASDLVAMWQSEMAAMAADRELRETWTGMLALWASAANAALPLLSRLPHDGQAGGAGAVEPARAAPAAAAFDLGVAEVQHLHQRIAELEQRLAELERGRKRHGG
jgi:ubiquinone biosynthesis protein UbiJ